MENEKKLTIGFFNDVFYPFVDGVVQVVDNYARLLSKKSKRPRLCAKRSRQTLQRRLPL